MAKEVFPPVEASISARDTARPVGIFLQPETRLTEARIHRIVFAAVIVIVYGRSYLSGVTNAGYEGADCFEVQPVDFIEGVESIRIDIQHSDESAVRRDDGDHYFRACRAGTGDVPGELMDIGDKLRRSRSRGGTTDAPVEGDLQAAVHALVGPDLEQPRRRDPIEPRPIEVVKAVMKLAHDGRHDGNQIILARDQSLYPTQCGVV
jgi:hypothetical protein